MKHSEPKTRTHRIPELPEVETIRSQLSDALPFHIEEVTYSPVVSSILKEKDRAFDPQGKTIVSFERQGKILIMKLNDGTAIVSGLGMSGSWRLWKQAEVVPHTHVAFSGRGNNGHRFISYVDPRRFGTLHYYDREGLQKRLDSLGVDISKAEFTSEYVFKALKQYPNRQFKAFLLDQKFFAGCGNYIACEICARAGIRPTRRNGRITKKECERIVAATKSVLEGQIKNKGLTFSGGYTDANGSKGEGVRDLVVFHQAICGLCETTPVKKIVLAQRGTYYCPQCQV